MTRAIVVSLHILNGPVRAGGHAEDGKSEIRHPEACLEEAVGLARAIQLDVVHSEVVRVSKFKPSTLLGSGKVKELEFRIESDNVELAVIDHSLSPIQQRNLERRWNCKVLDRTAIILEIFGARARTKEGRLQVELAHLNWQKSRLVRSWTHLERQRGGMGFLGGPGETQLESDRRLLQGRISKLERELEQVRRTRALHRNQRKKVPHLIVALVGYTNAGKSTLFNRLTGASVMAENLLFATLDPTMRKFELPHGGVVLVSDTVGFISNLPTFLIAAFKATLEEVVESDLILHVRDITHEDTNAQADDVNRTLEKLGIGDGKSKQIIEVWNKSDLLCDSHFDSIKNRRNGNDSPVLISAMNGDGLEELKNRIEDALSGRRDVSQICLPYEQAGKPLAWLYEHGEILDRSDSDAGVELKVRVNGKSLNEFRTRYSKYLTSGAGGK